MVKLILVLVVLVIFVGPTVAKLFTPQAEPKQGGILYRSVRRFGPIKILFMVLLVVVLFPTAAWLLLR